MKLIKSHILRLSYTSPTFEYHTTHLTVTRLIYFSSSTLSGWFNTTKCFSGVKQVAKLGKVNTKFLLGTASLKVVSGQFDVS